MKIHLSGAVVVFGLTSILFGSGCADNGETLFIRQVPVPDPQDKCTVSADPGGAALFSGKLDASLGTTYRQYFLVGNQMVPRGDSARLRPETSRVQFYETAVEIYDSDILVDSFTVPVSGFVDHASDTSPAFGLVEVNPILTANTVDAVIGQHGPQGVFVVARVSVHGITLGGTKVKTGVFDFPIFVCGDRANKIACISEIRPTSCMDDLNFACVRGQDVPHDCREIKAVTGGKFDCKDSSGADCP